MEPTLRSGEVVLVNPHAVANIGDLVVSRHPTRDLHVVKQVGRIDQRGRMELVSPRGDDSRVFGPVERTAVLGVVTVNLSTRRRVERRGASVDPQANTADV
jgi:phage repressor protein C with HTH and peptisase S24 domain